MSHRMPATTTPSLQTTEPAGARPQFMGCREWLFALALLVVTLAAYHPAWHGKPVWDDDAHMTSAELRSCSGLARIWLQPGATQQYYPLVHTVFWVEQKIWGDSTPGYHLVNIVLHVFCALLLLKILRFLEVPGAWLAAAIFALHPVEVESVAWISELKNTLSGAFYLAAALAYLRFDQGRNRRLYRIALGLFFLGLFCKTVIATLPAALLVVFWWKRGTLSWKQDVKPLIPFFALGIVMGLFTVYVEKRYIISDQGAAFQFTLAQRFLIAGRAFWFYIGKLLWPGKLIFIYPRWDVDGGVWWQYLFPMAALALLAGLWMLRKRTRAPLAAALFFGGTLFPALGFVNVYPFIYSFVADHFQYLAGIGIITLASAGAALLLERLRDRQKQRGYLAVAAVLMALAALTWRQCGIYTDTWTLYTTTIKQNPGCWLAWNNLGLDIFENGRVEESIGYFEKAIALNPGSASIQYDLANALVPKGRAEEAIAHYEKAIAIKPDLAEAHLNLGLVFFNKGLVQEAMVEYQEALDIKPRYAEAQNNLGAAFNEQGQPYDAILHYRKALEIYPDYAQAHYNLANVLRQHGHIAEAIEHYQKALKIESLGVPALNNLSYILATCPDASLRNGKQAVELSQQANQASGGSNPMILGTLAAAYAEAGRFSDAVETAGKALELAKPQSNTILVDELRAQIALYQAGKPLRDPSLANSFPNVP